MTPILVSDATQSDIPVTWEQLLELKVSEEDIDRGFTYFESVKQFGRYRSIKAAIEEVTLDRNRLHPAKVRLFAPRRMGYKLTEAGFTVRGMLKFEGKPRTAVASSRWLTLPDGREFELATLRLT